jgi:hypothetical protein
MNHHQQTFDLLTKQLASWHRIGGSFANNLNLFSA